MRLTVVPVLGLLRACPSVSSPADAKAIVTVGAPTSTTDRYLEACRSCLCDMVFLEVTCQVKRVPFADPMFIDSNVALSTLLRDTSRQS